MKKVLILSVCLVLLGWVLPATVQACCYLNEDIHNGSFEPAWDLLIIFCDDVDTVSTFTGHRDSWHFRQVSMWKAGGRTYLRYFDPANGAGSPAAIPHCQYVHIGYHLTRPARINEKIWTRADGSPMVPNGHIQNPSHWVYWESFPERVVTLKFTNDQTGVPPTYPPCPYTTVIGNISYAIVNEEIPLDSLNARNSWLMLQLKPLATGPFSLPDIGDEIAFHIPQSVQPGQVLVYRLEGTGGPNEFVSFGQHEMPAPATSTFSFLETFTPPLTPPANPVFCNYLHELYPGYCGFWHVLKWDKVPGQFHGNAVLDPAPFGDTPGCFRFSDLIIMTVVDSSTSLDTLKASYEGDFGPITGLLPVLNTQWHEIWPFFSNNWKILAWLDNGDGYLSPSDYLVIGLKPELVNLRMVHVISVRTGAQVDFEKELPALSHWGVAILVAVLAVSAVLLIRRRRRLATLAA